MDRAAAELARGEIMTMVTGSVIDWDQNVLGGMD